MVYVHALTLRICLQHSDQMVAVRGTLGRLKSLVHSWNAYIRFRTYRKVHSQTELGFAANLDPSRSLLCVTKDQLF
jgi:capsule polysaccharide modification protein KpsS